MNDRQARWHGRLYQLDSGSPSEPLILNEAMISQWLQEHSAEYNSALKQSRNRSILHLRLNEHGYNIVGAAYEEKHLLALE